MLRLPVWEKKERKMSEEFANPDSTCICKCGDECCTAAQNNEHNSAVFEGAFVQDVADDINECINIIVTSMMNLRSLYLQIVAAKKFLDEPDLDYAKELLSDSNIAAFARELDCLDTASLFMEDLLGYIFDKTQIEPRAWAEKRQAEKRQA